MEEGRPAQRGQTRAQRQILMPVFKTQLDSRAVDFRANAASMRALVADLRDRYQHWMGIFEKIAKDAGAKPQ